MTTYNNRIRFSVLQTAPTEWDHDLNEDQHMYEVIRSFDYGSTWLRYVICMNKEDADQLAGTLNWVQDRLEDDRISNQKREIEYFDALLNDPTFNKNRSDSDKYDC